MFLLVNVSLSNAREGIAEIVSYYVRGAGDIFVETTQSQEKATLFSSIEEADAVKRRLRGRWNVQSVEHNSALGVSRFRELQHAA